jgi:hypothetical protein
MMNLDTAVTTAEEAQFISVIETSPQLEWASAKATPAGRAAASEAARRVDRFIWLFLVGAPVSGDLGQVSSVSRRAM